MLVTGRDTDKQRKRAPDRNGREKGRNPIWKRKGAEIFWLNNPQVLRNNWVPPTEKRIGKGQI